MVVTVVTTGPRSRSWWVKTGFRQGLFQDDALDPGAAQSVGKWPRHKGPRGAALTVDKVVGASRALGPCVWRLGVPTSCNLTAPFGSEVALLR